MRLAPIAALSLVLTTAALAQDTTILAYHEVDPVPERGWAVSSEDFAEQMRYLALAGYNVVPISALVDSIDGRRDSLLPNAVVITVDDGWLCAATEIEPVLKRFGFPWSLYVYPKIVGQGSHALTWPQIAELEKAGVDVEGHTMSHAHLMHKSHPELNDAQYDAFLRTELDESKRVIESHTGQLVRFLAYPYGDYDDAVVAAAKRAGYEAGLLSWFGPNTSFHRSDEAAPLRNGQRHVARTAPHRPRRGHARPARSLPCLRRPSACRSKDADRHDRRQRSSIQPPSALPFLTRGLPAAPMTRKPIA